MNLNARGACLDGCSERAGAWERKKKPPIHPKEETEGKSLAGVLKNIRTHLRNPRKIFQSENYQPRKKKFCRLESLLFS